MTDRQPQNDSPAQGTWTRLIGGAGKTGAGGADGNPAVRAWRPGDEILGTYAVEQVISGGMGHVYIAYHKKWHRKVAIKSPNEKMLAHKKLFARILREANAWVEMGLHPHIAYCYFVRNIAGIPHIFVEYVDGGNLRSWLKRRPTDDFREALNLAIQFCHGMAFAHGRGMIHRDIKPENILLTAEGILKITDFGIARTRGPGGDAAGADPEIAAADVLLTRVGASMGTPDYMSPEQSANAHDVDERADIFSFGVCLYEMFCGVRPKLLEIAEPPDPAAVAKGAAVPPDLARVILKCAAMNREARYSGFDALRTDLLAVFSALYGDESPFAGLEALAPEADGLSNKGVSLLELERFEEARECFEKALTLDSLHPQANWNLGRFHVLNETFFHPTHQDRAVDMVRQILKEGGLTDEDVEARIRRSLEENTFFRAISMDLEGHRDRVNAVAVSPCGRYVASGGSDGKVMIWDLDRGRRIRVLSGHDYSVNDLCFSPTGDWLATGGSDQAVHIWNAETGALLRTLSGHVMRVSCVAVSPDGRRIASAGDDRSIRIWDAMTGKPLMTLAGHGSAVNALVFPLAGEWLVSAGDGRRIRLWRMTDGKCHAIMESSGEGLSALAVSPDGGMLAAGGRDRAIHLFRMDTGARMKSLIGHKHWVHTLAFSPDGQFIISGAGDHTLRVWDGRTGHHLKTLEGHQREVADAAFSPDGRYLVSAGWDHAVKVWHANVLLPQLTSPLDYTALQRRLGARKRRLAEIEKDIDRSHFSKAYRAVLKSWSRDGYGRLSPFYPVFERLRSMGTLTGVHAVTPFLRLQAASRPVRAVHFSPDGRHVAAGDDDRQVIFWDVTTGETVKRFVDLPEGVKALSWSPDGRYLAAAADSVTIFDARNGETARVLPHPKRVTTLAFSPDGRLLITGCDDHHARVWESASGRLVRTLEGHAHEIQSVAVSGDGRFVASCSGPEIRVWDLETGALRHTFGGHRLFQTAMAFSRSGALLAAVTRGNEVLLRDAETGETQKILGGAVSDLTCLSFSPSGKYLIAGTEGQTLDVWSVATGEPLKSLSGHRGAVQAVDISGDGRFIASGSLDNTVRVWLIVPDLEFSGDLMPVAFSEKQIVARLDNLIDRGNRREAFQQLQEAWMREEFTNKKEAYRIYNRLREQGRHVGGYFAVLVEVLKGHTSYVRSVAFSPDGRTLASGSWDTTVRLWDMTRGVEAGVLKGHGTHVESVTFSPDGRFLASGGSDGLVVFWDVAAGSPIRTFSAHEARVRSLVFLRGGKIMVSAGDDNTIRFWDAETGRDIKTLRGDTVQVNAMAFSPEGGAFAVASDDGRVRFIRLKGERKSRRFSGTDRRINDVAFSADGRSLASAGDDRAVRVWDIATGRLTHIFRDHTAEVRAVAFSPDSAFLISGGEDTLVKLWHLPSGTLLQTLEGHLKGITSVGFSNDGQIAASASEDNTIRLWLIMPNLEFEP